ncbi:MAG: hypothetical protein C0453_17310 [Comamonadaceae bacterium]|nr:hypothetical protein [Comamonadaceae bacterium]
MPVFPAIDRNCHMMHLHARLSFQYPRVIAPLTLAVLVLGTLHGTAQAQAFDAVRLTGGPPGQSGGTVGAAVVAGQAYRGSDESRVRLYPGVDYQWANGWFAGTTNGIGVNLSRQPAMQYGARVTVDLGRKERRSAALRGMGDVDVRPELGAFFNLVPTPGVTLTSSLRFGSGVDRDGWVIDLGANRSWRITETTSLGVGVSATWANANYQQSYFGVTPAQAITSGYAPYRADAGVRDVRLSASWRYRIAPRTALAASVSVSSLRGDARSSPLTRERSPVSGVFFVAHAF